MEEYWNGHRERLRLRVEKEGIESLKDHEALELILCYGIPRTDMSDIARMLLDRFGTIENVMNADRKQLSSLPGMGKALTEWILLTSELMKAYLRCKPLSAYQINRFKDAMNYLMPLRMGVVPQESWMVYCDFERNLMTRIVLCDSLSWAEPEYVIQSIKDCISLKVRYAFLVLFPGNRGMDESYEMEHLLPFARSLRGIGVDLMDCIIVEEDNIRSLNMERKMDNVRLESKALSFHESYADDGEQDGEDHLCLD